MRNFVFGVVVTVVALVAGGLGLALLGFLPTNANTAPPRLERQIAIECAGRLHGAPCSARERSRAADR